MKDKNISQNPRLQFETVSRMGCPRFRPVLDKREVQFSSGVSCCSPVAHEVVLAYLAQLESERTSWHRFWFSSRFLDFGDDNLVTYDFRWFRLYVISCALGALGFGIPFVVYELSLLP